MYVGSCRGTGCVDVQFEGDYSVGGLPSWQKVLWSFQQMLPWGFIEDGWELLLDAPSKYSLGWQKSTARSFRWMLLWGFIEDGREPLLDTP